MSGSYNDRTMSYLIDQHIEVLKAQGAPEATRIGRERCLRRLHDDLPCGWVFACYEQLVAWLAYEKWSQWTRCTYTGHIIAGYAWLHEQGHTPTGNPAARLRRPKAPRLMPRPASDDQLAIALSAPEPLLTAVLLARYEGLRRFEAAACWREDITEDTVTVRVAKGGDTQTVPTHPAVWQHVADMAPGPLITELDGSQMSAERLGALALRWFRRVGLPAFGLHRLRHLYGTEIQRDGRDLRVTQECLRHRSIQSTQGYTFVTDEQRRNAVRRLRWDGNRAGDNGPVPPAPTA